MNRFAKFALAATLMSMSGGLAQAQPPKAKVDIASLGWLAGTRYIARDDGSKSYETWTGPAAGIVSGAVASPNNGGLSEFFRIGPNDKGEYGLLTANTNTGLTSWRFQPLKSLEPGKIVFAEADGSRSFSIEAVPGGAIHNVALRTEAGKTTKTEWMWLPIPAAK